MVASSEAAMNLNPRATSTGDRVKELLPEPPPQGGVEGTTHLT
jgi:hypothetical protein